MEQKADIGLVGIGVMGGNLALNMAEHGLRVAVFNRDNRHLATFLASVPAGYAVAGFSELSALAAALSAPRKVFLLVPAGAAVDQVLDRLLPLLAPGDIVIDGGNSHFADTGRRVEALATKGIHFVGCGVSGGEQGARRGPSLMPGGAAAAWPLIESLLMLIAARAPDGSPCCAWIGGAGAGHFVKMVHNGIEYGDMQLICESYDLMRSALGMGPAAMSPVFAAWNRTELSSYLVEITATVLAKKEGDGFLVDRILDVAGQKGTGQWSAVAALEGGVPLSLIAQAVFARFLSVLREERQTAAALFRGPAAPVVPESGREELLEVFRQALYCAKILSYAQGFMLLRQASRDHGWGLDCGAIARVWRAGCIIRAAFLDRIKDAFHRDPGLANLLLDPFFAGEMRRLHGSLRRAVCLGIEHGVPLPAMGAALAFFDGYRSDSLPANLLQAQRDFFGAHTCERNDRPRGTFFHADWSD